MGHNISGTQTYTPNVYLPDDGDDRNAASVNAALTALANRTAFLSGRLAGSNSQTYLSSGSFTVPDRCRTIVAIGYGGGGGGANGTTGTKTTNQRAGGGGGGGGAVLTVRYLFVTPGDVLSVHVGAGGIGGALGVVTDGERSWISNTTNPSVRTVYFPGGGAGSISGGSVDPSQYVLFCAGGVAGGSLPGLVSRGAVMPSSAVTGSGVSALPMTPGQGGNGSTLNGGDTCSGASNEDGVWTGGTGGNLGADSGAYLGGGAGGGGGGGPGGPGANGGTGSPGNSGGSGTAGENGGVAAPNSGAGGGGGGGGGAAATGASGGIGGLGGAGGSGAVLLYWISEGY